MFQFSRGEGEAVVRPGLVPPAVLAMNSWRGEKASPPRILLLPRRTDGGDP